MRKTVVKNHRLRERRSLRVRRDLHGTAVRPRLCVIKTNKHIHAQLINDDDGTSLGGIGTVAKEFRDTEFGKKGKAAARKIGEKIAEMAKANNIHEIIFDRGPSKFHGILAELADAAKSGGLKF